MSEKDSAKPQLRQIKVVQDLTSAALDFTTPASWGQVRVVDARVVWSAGPVAETVSVYIVDETTSGYTALRAATVVAGSSFVWEPDGGPRALDKNDRIRVVATNAGGLGNAFLTITLEV